MLDHTAGYATFPNIGKAVAAHAIIEVRSGNGEIVWRFDRDGKKPEQVLRPQVALDMNMIMNKVVEEGTGKRAILEGVKAAGKTGTTNAYRDAWFVGYTGNYVCGVWYGNDDYAPTNRMTGGSLPAMTWRQIMAYAHQGIEVKNIPGVPAGPTPAAPPVAAAQKSNEPSTPRPTMLTKRSMDVLLARRAHDGRCIARAGGCADHAARRFGAHARRGCVGGERRPRQLTPAKP